MNRIHPINIIPVVSMAGPSRFDMMSSNNLLHVLKTHNIFESPKEYQHRIEVLGILDSLVNEWIYELCLSRKMPPSVAAKVRGKICEFGSCRLKVHQKGADIDVLCIAPIHVTRADFFSSFLNKLKDHHDVNVLRHLEHAFVPIIKMKLKGIEIDLLFARLTLYSIPKALDLRDLNLLIKLDQKCVRSLNGCRVSDQILLLVPDIANFRLTLHAIKLWAKRQGIFSNILGYLGGVSWAILVAKICQLFPNAAPSTLIHSFFLLYSRWQWPQPVLLKLPVMIDLGYPAWDPNKNVSDRYHLMPIITPAYPQQNCSFNITSSTLTIIQEAFNKGLAITNDIMNGTANWHQLYKPSDFFSQYNHFIVITASSSNADDQLIWSGLVDTKVRHFVQQLESHEDISFARVDAKCYPGLSQTNSKRLIGLSYVENENLNVVDFTQAVLLFKSAVFRLAGLSGMLKDGMAIEVRHLNRRQLLEEQIFDQTNNRGRRDCDDGYLTAPFGLKSLVRGFAETTGSPDNCVPVVNGVVQLDELAGLLVVCGYSNNNFSFFCVKWGLAVNRITHRKITDGIVIEGIAHLTRLFLTEMHREIPIITIPFSSTLAVNKNLVTYL